MILANESRHSARVFASIYIMAATHASMQVQVLATVVGSQTQL